MKKQMISLMVVAFAALTVVSCKQKAEEAKTGEAQEETIADEGTVRYAVDPEASTIEWKGFKPTGEHLGTIAVESGTLEVDGGEIKSGTILIDMASIVVTDIPSDDEDNAKLAGHLISEDFFHVEEYPNAVFTITGYEEGKLSGNLKMKDATNNVTFPVTVTDNGDKVTLTSETFSIDRSKWNVKYGSKSFFDNLGDNFINDEFELTVRVVADKN